MLDIVQLHAMNVRCVCTDGQPQVNLQVEVGDLRVADVGCPRLSRRVHRRLRAHQRQQWTHSGVQREDS